MSEPLPEGYVEDAPQVYEGGTWPGEPIRVQDVTERRTPELVSTMTWQIPVSGVGQPVQLLQRTERRFKAKITINSLTGGGAVVFSQLIDRVQLTPPQGTTYSPTVFPFNLPDWESVQPLYAIVISP